jgi:predicted O-methyltransferase YrrM
MENIRSSYKENEYGSVFRALVLAQRPRLVVECGVLDGYSTFNIAHALRFNRKVWNIRSEFFAYDLWEEYDYKHGDFLEVEKMLKDQRLDDFVNLTEGDAFNIAQVFSEGSVDFLHMDISNNGETLVKTLEIWGDKLAKDGMIAFEGGSQERDNVEWMVKYEFRSIQNVLLTHPLVRCDWVFQVLSPFPSMTLLWKKKK